MRRLRSACVVTVAVASLALPAVAAGAPTVSVSPTGQLGPEGASAVVSVTASCDPGTFSSAVSVTVVQAQGKRLVQGSGSSGGTMGGAPLVCDGTPQLVPVTVRVFNAPLKSGRVAVTASVSQSGPTGFITTTVGPLEAVLKK